MLKDEEDYKKENFLFILLMSANVALTLVVMLAACLCCKKKIPKNDLMGLEGKVKLNNPDDVVVVTTLNTSESHADLNNSTISQGDSEKRASTAAHRSLPDIPVADVNGDTGSELYETVADKMLLESQNQIKSPTPSLKKQISVSQHSSISQADDVSSPYSRVKNSPHDYAKVRPTEHPYAQLNAPSTSQSANAQLNTSHVDISSQSIGTQSVSIINEQQHQQRTSHHSDNSQNHNETPAPQVEIPAASAIAGMISASQDLPYMTPPIANQHFSGDSQDSSKGYTSISVREPLANILAQQPAPQVQIRSTTHSRDVNDSHYATVSDDSDETYAAIEDPNTRLQHANTTTDIYTSGSETYAQIQPMQSPNSIVVSVEINNASTSTLASSNSTLTGAAAPHNTSLLSCEQANTSLSSQHSSSTVIGPLRSSLEHNSNNTPIPPPVDSLRAQMHSRQASASSNNSSSLCNLGSPKPEKRQANSPLPPTPKSNLSSSTQLQAMSSTSNLTSGRNSVMSVIECAGELNELGSGELSQQDGSPQRRNKSLSPSKDIEGMYAKVMKKNKFSRNSPSSQNNSPVLQRKNDEHNSANLGLSPLDSMAADLLENNVSVLSSGDRSRLRSNSYGATKDHGYETIPADAMRSNSSHGVIENRKSDCYAHILQKERQREGVHTSSKPPITVYSVQLNSSDKHYETIANPGLTNSSNDPGYETLLKPKINSSLIDDSEKKSSDYDPNYEVLKGPNVTACINSAGASDDGYAKVLEKKRINIDEDSIDGYSKVKGEESDDMRNVTTGGYSTIADVKGPDANHNYASILEAKGGAEGSNETDSDHYARIAEKIEPTTPTLPLSNSSKSMVDELLTPRTADLSITSPTSITSSSILNTSSINSTSTNQTTTSTISSRQTPTSSSQYESLTGSETDPNYESVCYLNTSGQENPYERLQTEFSDDTQLSSPPLSPATSNTSSSAHTPSAMQTEHSTNKTLATNGSKINLTADPNADILVNDYFQV
ncbi:hypothetical protein FF38_11901 [Lucilia cuprina]|uniref:Serine-rich adhesin for platelets n=1 Tax=Lucilia cuprina TaxID=7375 RepID=A0A0L0BYH4_LUCCU|nr:hypothetical protein FF38_11901 [Lucilia cuprina]